MRQNSAMRVGVVGVGGMGSVHARKYALMDDVELCAFDMSGERLEAYCSQFLARSTSSLDELLSSVDVVDICTPTDSHLVVAEASIAAGKPTLVEKPMARTVAQCRKMIDAAMAAGVPLMPGQVVRFFPEFAAAHQAVIDGKVGRPATVRTRRGGRAPKGSDLWFRDEDRSGGILLDLAVHDFDWMRWTFGEVKSVFARTVRLGPGVADAEFTGDYALTTLEFESGCLGHAETTWMDPSGFRATFEICGSDGMIEYDSRDVPNLRVHGESGSRSESALAPTDDPFYRQLRAFLDAVRDGAPLPVSADDGMRAVAIAEAAIESARTCQPVAL